MSRPKITIEKEKIDHLLDAGTLFGVLLMVGLPLLYYSQLPEKIPIHFNLAGEPDGWAGKSAIWFLPLVSLVTIGIMWAVVQVPHTFNYPVKITEENAEVQYRLSTRLIRGMNFLIAIFLAYITWVMIQAALGNYSGMGVFSTVIFLVGIFGGIGYYLQQAKARK